MLCHCGGDIDDCEFDGTPEQMRCGHCADRDDEDYDDGPLEPRKDTMKADDIENTAGLLYETYCTAVGGKAFNGDLLPRWETFRADLNKRKQSDAWVEVARKASDEFRRLTAP